MLIQSIRNERRTMDEERRKLIQQIQQERSAGILEGKQEGILEGKLEIARSMLQEGLGIDFIMKITQLAREDIEKLKD